MREIKFRVWSPQLNRMVRFDEVTEPLEIVPTEQGFKFLDDERAINSVMQYTGLKDKNGKEIYEGDILKIYNETFPVSRRISVVTWNEKTARFKGLSFQHRPSRVCIVIGNIHENPELLTKGTI